MQRSHDRVAHWLRANHASRMPRRVVCLDSEAHRRFDGVKEEQTFRLAVASFDVLNEECFSTVEPKWYSTESPEELWTWIHAQTHSKHRTHVFAHHLSYDIRLTQALEHLPRFGWSVRQMAISDYGCWCFLRNGTKSLYLIDSLSHIPKSLDAIAEGMRRRKYDLPAESDPNDVWERHCRNDVTILRDGILQLLRLYRMHDLGDFRTTGAAQSSAAYRHRFLKPRTLLIHADNDALEAERRACWAGRAEVWQHGKVEGPLYEYDFHAAYAHVARDNLIPSRLIGEAFPSTIDGFQKLNDRYAVLSKVTVTTETPTVPAELDKRIVWPVGTFSTWLWDVEINHALKHWGTVEFERSYIYDRAPILHDWAEWIISCLAGKDLGATPIGKIVAKEWSRSLIGRFGLRYPLLDFQGTIDTSDLMLQPIYDMIEERSYMQLQVGCELYEQTERIESPNSCPQVMGYVMSVCRVLLWQAMQIAGFDNVCSVDTDGLIVNQAGSDAILACEHPPWTVPLRPKGRYLSAEIRGPRNLDLDDTRRVTGVPRTAERMASGIYRGELWESLPTALRRKQADRLLIHERTFSVAENDPRRLHLPGGRTAAIRLPVAQA